jgi:hypothetical protein
MHIMTLDENQTMPEALRALGAQPTDFAFEPNGMQTWHVYSETDGVR